LLIGDPVADTDVHGVVTLSMLDDIELQMRMIVNSIKSHGHATTENPASGAASDHRAGFT
jgi:hypothetical protein